MGRLGFGQIAAMGAAIVLAGCSVSPKAVLANGSGREVTVVLNGAPVVLGPDRSSAAFILAVGNQTHWDRTLRSGGCLYTYDEPRVRALLGPTMPRITDRPIVLQITGDFRLQPYAVDGQGRRTPVAAAGTPIEPRRTCN